MNRSNGSVPRLLLAVFALGGCGQQPILPGTGEIPITAWRVLANMTENNDLIYTNNFGCRLSDVDINIRIAHLKKNAPTLYRSNVKLTWSGIIVDIDDPQLQQQMSGGHGRTRNVYNWDYETIVERQLWAESTLNVYFVGDLQDNGGALALTGDPEFAYVNGTNPYIVFNDCGFALPSGFDGITHPTICPASHGTGVFPRHG